MPTAQRNRMQRTHHTYYAGVALHKDGDPPCPIDGVGALLFFVPSGGLAVRVLVCSRSCSCSCSRSCACACLWLPVVVSHKSDCITSNQILSVYFGFLVLVLVLVRFAISIPRSRLRLPGGAPLCADVWCRWDNWCNSRVWSVSSG